MNFYMEIILNLDKITMSVIHIINSEHELKNSTRNAAKI